MKVCFKYKCEACGATEDALPVELAVDVPPVDMLEAAARKDTRMMATYGIQATLVHHCGGFDGQKHYGFAHLVGLFVVEGK